MPITSSAKKALRSSKRKRLVNLVRKDKMIKTVKKIGSIHVPDSRVKDEDLACPMGEVLAMGPEAYGRKDMFPAGDRCAIGDTVFIGSYVGSKLRVGADADSTEYRLVSDDDVKAVIPYAASIRRDM